MARAWLQHTTSNPHTAQWAQLANRPGQHPQALPLRSYYNIHRHIAYYTPSIMHHNFLLLKLMSSTLFELALQSMLLSQPVLWHVVCSAALPVRHTGKQPSQLSAPACASLGPDTCSRCKSERSLVRASIDAAHEHTTF
jgi:hypothetical protein